MTTPRKHPRLRRIAKWAALIACVLIVVAWGVSLWLWVWYDGDSWASDCSGGVLGITISTGMGGSGWGSISLGLTPQHAKGVYWIRCSSDRSCEIPWSVVTVPLWLPLLVLAIPTAFLWHRDRRRIPPGHCQQCGYDLTGNESGVCSECGTGVTSLGVGPAAPSGSSGRLRRVQG